MGYDIIVIGSGPAGYRAAVTAAHAGKKVCVVEKGEPGGVCVNKGCIPTKAVLNVVSLFYRVKDKTGRGINADGISLEYPSARREAISTAARIKESMLRLFKAQGIDFIRGQAEIVSENTVAVSGTRVEARNIIVSAGSRPKALKGFPFNDKTVFSAETFLNLEELPRKVIIAGAGAVGCEWAAVLSAAGAAVTLIEAQEKILPEEDADLSRVIERNLKRRGVDIMTSTLINNVQEDIIIVCAGREPVREGLELIETTPSGWIKTDRHMQTQTAGIYAAGDAAGPPLLAYTAEREGMTAAYNICGIEKEVDYEIIPRVVFSYPEFAYVGLKEDEAENAAVVRAYFKGLSRAEADGETEGLIKIVYDKYNYTLLGAGIAGAAAGELINEAALALKTGITVKEWEEVIRPHPVYSEIFSLALSKIK